MEFLRIHAPPHRRVPRLQAPAHGNKIAVFGLCGFLIAIDWQLALQLSKVVTVEGILINIGACTRGAS